MKVLRVTEKPTNLDGSEAKTKRLEILIEGHPEPFIVFLNHGMGGIKPTTPITKERWGDFLLEKIKEGEIEKRILIIETGDGLVMGQFDPEDEVAADEEALTAFYE